MPLSCIAVQRKYRPQGAWSQGCARSGLAWVIDRDSLQLLDYDAYSPRFQSSVGQDPAFKRRLMRRVDVTLLHCGIFNRWLPCSITRVKTSGGFYQVGLRGRNGYNDWHCCLTARGSSGTSMRTTVCRCKSECEWFFVSLCRHYEVATWPAYNCTLTPRLLRWRPCKNTDEWRCWWGISAEFVSMRTSWNQLLFQSWPGGLYAHLGTLQLFSQSATRGIIIRPSPLRFQPLPTWFLWTKHFTASITHHSWQDAILSGLSR